MLTYEEQKRIAWEELYDDDEDEPIVSWEDFKEDYFQCTRCGNWEDDQCICYAR